MKTKLWALWTVLTAQDYLVITSRRTIGVVPKEGDQFDLMRRFATKLAEIQAEKETK